MRRAVITGLGIVSSIGNNKDEVTTSLREGRSGITFSEEFEQAGMRSQVWGKVDIDINGDCTNFKELSNQPFTYVPFAYYSPASDTPGPAGEDGNGIVNTINNVSTTATNGSTIHGDNESIIDNSAFFRN